jgi:hypothetical protein
LPKDDYGVRNGFRIAYGLRDLPKPAELARHGERWAPYRSRAVEIGRRFDATACDDGASIRRQRPGARNRSRRRRAS